MERALCERCGARQPPGWRPGELCQACGQPVRTERRCAWCLAWSPVGRFCRACGCELPPPDRFGAARLLKDAGVDRFSLGERLRAMDAEQAEDLERRYAEQRARVEAALEPARFAEGFLLTSGLAAALEEELLGRLPMAPAEFEALSAGPPGPFTDPAQLTAILASSPLEDCRDLAALALVRLGSDERAPLRRALGLCQSQAPLALEAALALAHWRFHFAPGAAFGPNPDLRRLRELALPYLEDPRLGSWAALAAGLALRSAAARPWTGSQHEAAVRDLEALTPALRRGLDARDSELAFGCALLLGDEERLGAALGHARPEVRAAARQALLGRGARVAEALAGAEDEDERGRLLGCLPHPCAPGALTPALAAAARSAPLARHAVRLLRATPYEGWGPEARAEAARWLEGDPPLLAEDALDLLAWACEPWREAPGPRRLRLAGEARAFAEHATRVLGRLPAGERQAALHQHGFTRWLWTAGSPAAQALLDAWATGEDEALGRALCETLSSLDSMADRLELGDLPRAWQLLAGLWERAAPEALRALARAVRVGWSWSYSQDEQATWAFVRARYLEQPDERPALRLAFEGLLRRLGQGHGWEEKHPELLPGQPPGGEQPVAFFEELCRLAPEDAYAHVLVASQGMRSEQAEGLARALFRHLQALRASGETGAYRLMPPAVAFARWLDEARAAAPGAALGPAAEVLRAGWEALTACIPPPPDGTESYYIQEKRDEVAGVLARVEAGAG
ncbi:MAG TPA: zinc ribbon domain-containing protein [Myxococcota bacterium]|nr:zinc ribbon domain-containing protein [Myxococcota bacterium]HRY95524.1 zinc ribbon domain-containing protein [Myxococcota bacterium]HSA19926.1 zinc ribbon domain-containing protein [Myxococcota bacterium]